MTHSAKGFNFVLEMCDILYMNCVLCHEIPDISDVRLTKICDYTRWCTEISDTLLRKGKNFKKISKFLTVQVMKALKRSGDIDPPILHLELRCDWSTSRPSKFSVGKVPLCPFKRRFFGPHSRCGLSLEETKHCPCRIQIPNQPAWILVILPAKLMNEL
jgi:hypothetical protein